MEQHSRPLILFLTLTGSNWLLPLATAHGTETHGATAPTTSQTPEFMPLVASGGFILLLIGLLFVAIRHRSDDTPDETSDTTDTDS